MPCPHGFENADFCEDCNADTAEAEVGRLRVLLAECRRTIKQNMEHFGGRMHEEELVARIDAALAPPAESR